MNANLSKIPFRQTQELLSLVDMTLREICCRKFSGKELYVEALQKVLGNNEGRSPESVFIVFNVPEKDAIQGRMFFLNSAGFVEQSDMIAIDQADICAISLSGVDVVRSNWGDTCESM